MTPPIVLIEWEDHGELDNTPWVENNPITKSTPIMFTSVGFVVFEDDHRLILVSCWSPDTTSRRDQLVKSAIKRRITLKAK